MKSITPIILGAVVTALPVAAMAQDVTGGATLGFGSISGPDGFPDVTTRALDGAIGLDYDNGLRLGASASSVRADLSGIEEDISANVFGLTAGASFSNFWNAGVYYEYGKIGIVSLLEASIDSYGLFLGYDSDLMGFEVFAGTTDSYLLSGTGVDWADVGASASFKMGANSKIGGHVVRSRLSGGGDEVDLTTMGLGGSYGFGNGLVGYAGVTHGQIDDLVGDLTTVGLGVGYDLSDTANFPAMLSFEVARSRLDDGVDNVDLDTIRFGVTLPLGGGKAVPMNSVAANAMSPNRTALSTAIVGAF